MKIELLELHLMQLQSRLKLLNVVKKQFTEDISSLFLELELQELATQIADVQKVIELETALNEKDTIHIEIKGKFYDLPKDLVSHFELMNITLKEMKYLFANQDKLLHIIHSTSVANEALKSTLLKKQEILFLKIESQLKEIFGK